MRKHVPRGYTFYGISKPLTGKEIAALGAEFTNRDANLYTITDKLATRVYYQKKR